MNALRALDHAWFAAVHDDWRNALLDRVMPLASSKWTWIPLIAAFFAYSGWHVGRRTIRLAILSILLVLAADLAANVLKGEVRRIRPGHLASEPQIVAGRRASFSFPSSAATNAFAATSLWSVWHPELAVPLLAAAALVSYSRVYLGDHYPSDVGAGALLGSALGLASAALERRARRDR